MILLCRLLQEAEFMSSSYTALTYILLTEGLYCTDFTWNVYIFLFFYVWNSLHTQVQYLTPTWYCSKQFQISCFHLMYIQFFYLAFVHISRFFVNILYIDKKPPDDDIFRCLSLEIVQIALRIHRNTHTHLGRKVALYRHQSSFLNEELQIIKIWKKSYPTIPILIWYFVFEISNHGFGQKWGSRK